MKLAQMPAPIFDVFQRAAPLTLLDKVLDKVSSRRSKAERMAARHWCESHCEDYGALAKAADAALWAEAQHYAAIAREHSHEALRQSLITFGGAAAYDLLYFLVRLRKPRIAVETGVAAGWSSAAILRAMHKNGSGQLYSSDFPYIRQRSAREHIGVLVPSSDRAPWTLMTDGDRRNLPKIVNRAAQIDLFHYDSDKSYTGRTFATRLVRPYLAPDALLVFDDVQDNCHFAELAEALALPFHVFKKHRKFVGVIALAGSPFASPAHEAQASSASLSSR